jgi:hypothetical protein
LCTYSNSELTKSITSNATSFDINDILTIYDEDYMIITLDNDDSYVGYYLLTLTIESIYLDSDFKSFILNIYSGDAAYVFPYTLDMNVTFPN